jgi:hypothetical protein
MKKYNFDNILISENDYLLIKELLKLLKKRKATMNKWQNEFQRQYLLQQNEYPTKQNIKEYGLDMDYSELLKETKTAFIIYHNEGNPTINIIYKNGRFMESLEIA